VLLEAAGSQTVEVGDKKLSAKRFMAQAVWSIVTTGKVTLPDGREWTVEPDEWLDTVKWIYQHIDGPPKAGPAGTEDDPIHYKVYQGFDPTQV
jgi:hypothetical protein